LAKILKLNQQSFYSLKDKVMKKITIISAMLILTLSISAQTNRSRTANSDERAKSTATKTTPDKSKEVESTKSTEKPSPAVRSSTTSRSSSSETRSRSTGTVNRSSTERISPTTSARSSNRGSSVNTGTTAPDRNRTTTTTTTRTRTVQSGITGSNNRSTGSVRSGSDNRRVATTTSRTSSRVADPAPTSRRISNPDEYRPVDRNAYSSERKVYYSYHPNRVVRTAPVIKYNVKPIEYRRVHYPYAAPVYREIYWNMNMYNEYIYLYPNYNYWYHPFGYKIQTVSAYDASSFIGDIARIYGRVYDTWYNRENDEYYLYFGGPFPYQDFSVIVDGNDARRFNWKPERYFKNRNIVVTGLVGFYDGKPEMIIKKSSQIDTF
jgi:hypothetical protein